MLVFSAAAIVVQASGSTSVMPGVVEHAARGSRTSGSGITG